VLGAGQSDLRCSSGHGVMPGGESCGDERGEPGSAKVGWLLPEKFVCWGAGSTGVEQAVGVRD